jgi:cyclic beta-1,2-glucan synthetase
MYRVAVESLLGFDAEGGTCFTLAPRIPDDWPGFTLTHRELDGTCYEIRVTNPQRRAGRVVRALLDGQAIALDGDALRIPVAHDGRRHQVLVTLGVPLAAAEGRLTRAVAPEQ